MESRKEHRDGYRGILGHAVQVENTAGTHLKEEFKKYCMSHVRVTTTWEEDVKGLKLLKKERNSTNRPQDMNIGTSIDRGL